MWCFCHFYESLTFICTDKVLSQIWLIALSVHFDHYCINQRLKSSYLNSFKHVSNNCLGMPLPGTNYGMTSACAWDRSREHSCKILRLGLRAYPVDTSTMKMWFKSDFKGLQMSFWLVGHTFGVILLPQTWFITATSLCIINMCQNLPIQW